MRSHRLVIHVVCVVWLHSLIGCGPRDGAATLRVGYQKWGTYSILKASGNLEATSLQVDWIEFSSGPSLLEAMNAGSLDLGHAGDSPPLFAQAAGVPFVYIGASSDSPDSSAILIRSDSQLRDAGSLKGKRVGFTKGSSAHTMVVRALESVGLSINDIEPVYLPPSDGRFALESGAIDAWSIWDPHLAAAEHSGTVRRLVSGNGLVAGREFYLASIASVTNRSNEVQTFLRELSRAKEWAKVRSAEVNRLLADQTGLDVAAVELAEARRNRYDTRPITDELIADQQHLADRYVELGLLPKRIDVRSAVHLANLVIKD